MEGPLLLTAQGLSYLGAQILRPSGQKQLLIKEQRDKPGVLMSGVLALAEAEYLTNLLYLHSIKEPGFIYIKSLCFHGLRAQMEKQLSPFWPWWSISRWLTECRREIKGSSFCGRIEWFLVQPDLEFNLNRLRMACNSNTSKYIGVYNRPGNSSSWHLYLIFHIFERYSFSQASYAFHLPCRVWL